MGYELRRVTTAEDLAAMHRIRRETLFAPRGRDGFYDDNHPDDAASNHIKFLLVLDGQPIGTTRLDLKGERAVVRLVGITTNRQHQGHGTVLEDFVTRHAHKLGITTLLVNAAADAVGFYEKCGWQREDWDPSELINMRSECVQMVKPL